MHVMDNITIIRLENNLEILERSFKSVVPIVMSLKRRRKIIYFKKNFTSPCFLLCVKKKN